MEWAVKIHDLLKADDPHALEDLLKRLDIHKEDISKMDEAAKKMFLPHDDALGIDMQDDSFLSKKSLGFRKDTEGSLSFIAALPSFNHIPLSSSKTA